MTLQMPHTTMARRAAKLVLMTALALTSGMSVSAGGAPIRLLGVSAEGNAVLIESTEPAAYAVKRPDSLTLLVELRNASVANATNLVERHDPIGGVGLEQASAADGTALARVRVSLTHPWEYTVRSTRNVIRLQLTAPSGPAPSPLPASLARVVLQSPATPPASARPSFETPAATLLDRVRASRAAGATTVTLSGNGRLMPADVAETPDPPRRLVLDFTNVASRVPAQTSVDSPLVKRVRVGLNTRQPLVTRVVMEVADSATYHVERAGQDGRDLAVIFEPAQATATIMLAPLVAGAQPVEAEPDIPLKQAIANAASITPKGPPAADPIAALKSAPPQAALRAPAGAPVAAAPVPAAPPVAAPPGRATVPAAAAPAPRRQQTPSTPALPQPGPAPADPQASSQQLVNSGTQKQYTGNPITLDFSGADLRSVLRYFNEISGLNIIIDPSVPSTPIDIVLRDVPWDQAFETLLRTHKLGYVAEGTIVRIAPISVLAEEEGDRRKLSEAKALAGDLRVQTFALSYAKAADMQPLLVKSSLSPRGQIQVDVRTNTIIITDLPDRLQTAMALIGTLDRPEPQVEVEARVVQTTREFAKAIGVQWGLNGRAMPDIGNTTNLAFPNQGTIGGRTGASNIPVDPRASASERTGNAVNLPVTGATSAIGLALGAVNGALNLDVALSALERSGKGRILSTPRLTTQNNVAASVEQGIQIPIQTVANNTVTVSFKDAVLKLQVTPQITSANTVIMQITLENASPDFSRSVNGIPPIDTQRAITQVQVDDGATTIIGGIFVSNEQISNERTPLMHRIPLLGWLFQRDSTTDASRELLIFITPRILKG
jgi:type IV pilus assembly protein PilQ